MASRRVLVLGASGFVGKAVVAALDRDGHHVETMTTPRLQPMTAAEVEPYIESTPLVANLAARFGGFEAVVNAAGLSDAVSTDERALTAANGAVPGIAAAACAAASGSVRFVHVSSAAVQGRAKRLDASDHTEGFSAYSRSKILGELVSLRYAPGQVVVYRPPGVHAADRRTTQRLGKIASSRWSTVAGRGDRPTPQALCTNVASAIALLATTELTPPVVVTHPSEGVTTAGLLELLGGRAPRRVPAPVGRALTSALFLGGRLVPSLSANARRLEMMLFGQEQVPSWLTHAGWEPPDTANAWRALGRRLRFEEDELGTSTR